jgi:predicted dehydrogenase
MKRKIRMGMVGGGRGAFIGGVHRHAAALDGLIELVCGAFSSSPEKSKASGEDLMLPPERCYGTFEEMFEKEKEREDGMDIVAIVTPNHMHFAPAKMALENGFHVVCLRAKEDCGRNRIIIRFDAQLHGLPDDQARKTFD